MSYEKTFAGSFIIPCTNGTTVVRGVALTPSDTSTTLFASHYKDAVNVELVDGLATLVIIQQSDATTQPYGCVAFTGSTTTTLAAISAGRPLATPTGPISVSLSDSPGLERMLKGEPKRGGVPPTLRVAVTCPANTTTPLPDAAIMSYTIKVRFEGQSDEGFRTSPFPTLTSY